MILLVSRLCLILPTRRAFRSLSLRFLLDEKQILSKDQFYGKKPGDSGVARKVEDYK